MKKIISLILALVMIFAMGATVFAANVGSIPSHDHEWIMEEYDWGLMMLCADCGIVVTEYFDNTGAGAGATEGEENPNTGAMSILGMAALVSAAAAACTSFKRK